MPRLFSAFIAWKTTLLCSVPPYSGCGWQTRAAWVASGEPAFSSASSWPAGPFRKKDRMTFVVSGTDTGYNEGVCGASRLTGGDARLSKIYVPK